MRRKLLVLVLVVQVAIICLKIEGQMSLKNKLDDKITLTAYIKEDCGFCEKLIDDILPQFDKDSSLVIETRQDDFNYRVNIYPTIVIRRGSLIKIIEGLPTIESLLNEINFFRRPQ